MKFYKVVVEEFSGYDCDGHYVNYIVAAENPMEAIETIMIENNNNFDITKFEVTISQKDGWVNFDYINKDDIDFYIPDETVQYVNEFILPDISTIKKPTIIR